MLEKEPMKLTTKNLYSYCDNNPVSKYDSNGECGAVATAVIVRHVALSVGSYFLSSALTKEKITLGGFGGAVVSGFIGGVFSGFEKLKNCNAIIPVVIDCVATAVICGMETGNLVYAVIAAIATEALALGSIPGMMGLLGDEDYLPLAKKCIVELFTGTVNNSLIGDLFSEDYGNDEESIAASAGNSSGIVYKRIGGEYFAFA